MGVPGKVCRWARKERGDGGKGWRDGLEEGGGSEGGGAAVEREGGPWLESPQLSKKSAAPKFL